jgi:hypothetical protein
MNMQTRLNGISCYIIGVLILCFILTGCSGMRPYPNTFAKNLYIKTEKESGSIFSKVRTAVEIYRVDERCKIKYEGTVRLDRPLVEVGIPSDRLSYLIFNFSCSSFLANSSSSISQDTLLKPRAGYQYDIKVSYIEDIYNVMIRETHPQKAAEREIELLDLAACGSL